MVVVVPVAICEQAIEILSESQVEMKAGSPACLFGITGEGVLVAFGAVGVVVWKVVAAGVSRSLFLKNASPRDCEPAVDT